MALSGTLEFKPPTMIDLLPIVLLVICPHRFAAAVGVVDVLFGALLRVDDNNFRP
jgi:hypothetical protein